MARIDYEKKLKELIEYEGFDNVLLGRYDRLTGREGVLIRRLPGARDERYQDGSYELQRLVQIIVRRRIASEAITDCEDIARALDFAVVESDNGSYEFVSQEVYTEPEEFALYEDGFATWSFRLRALLMIER